MNTQRTRAKRARGMSGAGRGGPPSASARFWLQPSTVVLLAGLVGGCGALVAGAPLLVGEAVLSFGLVAGLTLSWVEELLRARRASERRCRVCGCTDKRSCVEMDAFGDCKPCHWVESDLCSTCAGDPGCDDLTVTLYRRMELLGGNPFIGSEPCPRCDGAGTVLVCIDDLCNAQGTCMHGDGEAPCPECEGTGEA